MKVCTDACLFGAWTAQHLENIQPRNILDIGTGTGLLALMLAQKLRGSIDSIEINHDAYLQAVDNILNTPWKSRFYVINDDAKIFKFARVYDLIIANPPFYENELRSPDINANMARHDESLTLEALLFIAANNLADNGSFGVLIPNWRLDYFINVAAGFQLFPRKIENVKPSTKHECFRSMIILATEPSVDIEQTILTIKDGNNYTSEFIELLKDYYLYL